MINQSSNDNVLIFGPNYVRKQLNIGESGYVCVTKVPVYDTNVTINISSTTNTTYYGTLVIATQNNLVQEVRVYGDLEGKLINSLFYNTTSSSSKVLEIYFKPEPWSKNIIDVDVVNPADGIAPTDVATFVNEIPSSASNHPKGTLNNWTIAQGSNGNLIFS